MQITRTEQPSFACIMGQGPHRPLDAAVGGVEEFAEVDDPERRPVRSRGRTRPAGSRRRRRDVVSGMSGSGSKMVMLDRLSMMTGDGRYDAARCPGGGLGRSRRTGTGGRYIEVSGAVNGQVLAGRRRDRGARRGQDVRFELALQHPDELLHLVEIAGPARVDAPRHAQDPRRDPPGVEGSGRPTSSARLPTPSADSRGRGRPRRRRSCRWRARSATLHRPRAFADQGVPDVRPVPDAVEVALLPDGPSSDRPARQEG